MPLRTAARPHRGAQRWRVPPRRELADQLHHLLQVPSYASSARCRPGPRRERRDRWLNSIPDRARSFIVPDCALGQIFKQSNGGAPFGILFALYRFCSSLLAYTGNVLGIARVIERVSVRIQIVGITLGTKPEVRQAPNTTRPASLRRAGIAAHPFEP